MNSHNQDSHIKHETNPSYPDGSSDNHQGGIASEQMHKIAEIASNYAPDDKAAISEFVSVYYHTLHDDTLQSIGEQDLAGMALHHFSLLKAYDATQPQLSVFNPSVEEQHFHSVHSIVQMVAYDRPFLVDTLLMTLEKHGVNVHRIYHTIVHVSRDESGNIVSINHAENSDRKHLSLIHCEIDCEDDSQLAEIHTALLDKINTLDVVVGDWQAMRERLGQIKAEISSQPVPEVYHSKDEITAFLDWILDDHFIFMGFREYRLDKSGDELDLTIVGGSGLGLLTGSSEDKRSESFHQLPRELKQLLTLPRVLLLSKSSHISPVHRPVYMDFLGIHKFDDRGELIGEYRFIGLLTSQAYQLSVKQIPLLRAKANRILAQSNLPKQGHAHQKMLHIINALPRDDLFQATTKELYPIVAGIAQLQDKKRLRLFARIDHYQRFVSCLVYIPRDKFNTELRIKVQQALIDAYGGTSAGFTTEFNESNHARVHIHVRTLPGQVNSVDIAKLEGELTQLMQGWTDHYEHALLEQVGEQQANAWIRQYLPYIPAAYQEHFDVRTAVKDTQRLHQLNNERPMLWHLYQSTGEASNRLYLKLYGRNQAAILSNVLPVLENFGVAVLSAQTYEFDLPNQPVWMQEYALKLRHVDTIDMSVVRSQFEDSLYQIWQGQVESDRLNELVLTSRLDTFDVVILRALCRYMLQARAPFSIDYIQQTLVKNTAIAALLVSLFHARLQPQLSHSDDGIRDQAMDTQQKSVEQGSVEQSSVQACEQNREQNRQQKVAAIEADIKHALQQVASLDEDRIINWMLDLIRAILRTNFYQRDEAGKRKNRLSFKFCAADIPHLPKPKPMFEIFVYSPRVEAVHLRGGKVARGGLRWSDRMEDFRTEVLGLVKAQMVKNAVIVPVGSKGGFIVKDQSMKSDREAWQQEGIACYQTFLRGMLDITDNLIDGQVVAPVDTVRHDDDDPYLVVAADKGTASFSDIANGLSAEYNFWLGDAFASGGSVGYDHKGMGITARGAWESVKRHFRLMGKDIQAEDEFTCIGIGDMSGDVFGNGMLLSDNTRLLAAFNHLHIFIDPNPDSKASFAERQRLFALPRSSWSDYDPSLISAGGMVVSRQDKSVSISDEMKSVFAIEADSLTPDELIHALLKAPVDLLWNGGIGTYVKSSEQDHASVGDKANDNIRVNGNEVGAKIIGEGGNLGCTQRGRIEYAQHGGRIYTDAIDNSGGVNCSDHEVNIKILLGKVVEQGDMTLKQRNELLESMTDSVAQLVLRQNYLQPQAIELSASEAALRLSEHQQLMQQLESQGRLDRAIELLPSDEQISERQQAGQGLTNPELAVLLAYSKMWVYDRLLDSDVPDEPYFANELRKYFPDVLDEPYFEQMQAHRLHREIISTYLTNGLLNRLGVETVCRVIEETGQDVATITRAYAVTRDVFDIYKAWQILEELDNQVDAHLQIELELRVRQAFKRGMTWFINSSNQHLDVPKVTANFKQPVQSMVHEDQLLDEHFAEQIQTDCQQLQQEGLTKEQALWFARLPSYVYALDMVQLAQSSEQSVDAVAAAYFYVYDALSMGWLLQRSEALPQSSYWDRRAGNAISHELIKTLRQMVAQILANEDVSAALQSWKDDNTHALSRLQNAISGMDEQNVALSALSVLLSEMNALIAQD